MIRLSGSCLANNDTSVCFWSYSTNSFGETHFHAFKIRYEAKNNVVIKNTTRSIELLNLPLEIMRSNTTRGFFFIETYSPQREKENN